MPVIPTNLLMPFLTAVIEIIKLIRDAKDVAPDDRVAIKKMIKDAQDMIVEINKKWENV